VTVASKLVPALVVVAACSGKKQDDCQRFVDKSTPVLKGIGKAKGKSIKAKDLDDMVAACRSSGPKGDAALQKCVLDADTDDEVAACWSDAMGDYAEAGRKTEADLMLHDLAKLAREYHAENDKFPVGSEPLTPDCCAQPDHVCKPDDAIWAKGLWAQLTFSVDDDSHYRYAIDSTADKFTARAVGDADCDGQTVTHSIVVTVDDDGVSHVDKQTTGAD